MTLLTEQDIENVTLEMCKKKGLLVSRQVEIMMEQQIEEDKKNE